MLVIYDVSDVGIFGYRADTAVVAASDPDSYMLLRVDFEFSATDVTAGSPPIAVGFLGAGV